MAGLALTAILYLPSLFEFDNYTVAIFYRWWTVLSGSRSLGNDPGGAAGLPAHPPLRHRS